MRIFGAAFHSADGWHLVVTTDQVHDGNWYVLTQEGGGDRGFSGHGHRAACNQGFMKAVGRMQGSGMVECGIIEQEVLDPPIVATRFGDREWFLWVERVLSSAATVAELMFEPVPPVNPWP